MCSYREKKPDPTEMMQLDGFTVDYCEQVPGLSPFSPNILLCKTIHVHERVKHKIRKILYPFCLILKVQIKSFPPDAEGFGGKYFFNCVKEGDNVTFATDDENERTLWVQAIYRATGQTHKPVPPVVQTNKISNTQISRMQGGQYKSLILIITNAWPKIIVTNAGKSVRLGEVLAWFLFKIKTVLSVFHISKNFYYFPQPGYDA